MLRTTDPMQFRTLKPLYEHRIATPFGPCYLDGNFSIAMSGGETGGIWPGMVAAGPIGSNPTVVKIANQATDSFFGLFTHNCNTIIDELNNGRHVTAVWNGYHSCWRIFQPAYNSDAAYAVPDDGTEELLTWDANGRLIPHDDGNAVGGMAVAKLIGVGVNFIDVQLIYRDLA